MTTQPQEREDTKTKLLPPYNVILENDDYHTQDFVVGVLRKVLGCNEPKAIELMFRAHFQGRAVVWTGPKEVAELKVEQIQTFHQTLDNGHKLGPLGVTIEPAPG